MKVLGIDTAGPVVGIAYVDSVTEYSWEARVNKGADIHLLRKLEWIMTQYRPELVSVSVGPGSFTSLRVGVSIALGIAEALQTKIVAVSSLEARAKLAPATECLAVLDARKKRVYGQFFDSTSEIPVPLGEAQDIAIEAFFSREEFVATGEGAEVYRKVIEEAGGFVPCDATQNPALMVAKLGQLRSDEAIDPLHLSIEYIREAGVQPPKNLGIPTGKPQAK